MNYDVPPLNRKTEFKFIVGWFDYKPAQHKCRP